MKSCEVSEGTPVYCQRARVLLSARYRVAAWLFEHSRGYPTRERIDAGDDAQTLDGC